MHRRLLVAGSVALLCQAASFSAVADDGPAGRSGGDYLWQAHSPGFDRGYYRGSAGYGGHGHHQHGHHHHGYHHHHWHGGLGLGYYGGLAGGYFGYPHAPYGIYYQPSANYVEYFLPPYYEPAELYYGPLAVKQFLGLDRNFALGPLREPPLRLPLAPAPAADEAPGDEPPAVRTSNAAMRAKAAKYMADGDALYHEQRFHSALQKYKLAVRAAPDIAETHWRRAHALIATSNFELAAAAIKRALMLDGSIDRDGFRLDDLYAKAAMTKNVHQEILAEHVLENERSSDAWFLLGVFLHYDGQRERARKFFQHALDLAVGEAAHITAFLDADGLATPAIADEPARKAAPVAPPVAAPVPPAPADLARET